MNKRVFLPLALILIGLPAGPGWAGTGMNRAEIERRIRDHLNERMYNSCKTVVLAPRTDGTYGGYAEFLNGVRSRLRVVVSEGNIEYSFVEPVDRSATSEPTETSSEESLWTMLDEMEALARQQEVELARLQELCRQAGIDPSPPEANAPTETIASAADANSTPMSHEALAFTSSMYGRIQKGMSRAEVIGLLGAEGDPLSSSYFDGAANEIYTWGNLDGSHICVVFQDGKVLVKTQSGLPGIAPTATQSTDADQTIEIERFQSWMLAEDRNGQIISTGFSLGDWLESMYRLLKEKSSRQPATIDIVEEEDEIVVRLTREDHNNVTHRICFYLAPLASAANETAPLEDGKTERVLIPSRMTVNDRESDSPTQVWLAMARLAKLPL